MLSRFSRILVVDGCDASRNATHRVIHTLGYSNIDYAPDTRAALRLIGQNNYRLVLADWDKAPVNGMELLRQARIDRRLKFLPFLMSIAQWQKKFLEIVRDDGAALYLVRPFTAPVLAERMTQVAVEADRLKAAHILTSPASVPIPGRAEARIGALWQSLRPEI